MGKMILLGLLDSPKLISRKIWVTEKSWNFHTVWFEKKKVTYKCVRRPPRTRPSWTWAPWLCRWPVGLSRLKVTRRRPAAPMNAKAPFLVSRHPFHFGPALSNGFGGLCGRSVDPPIKKHHHQHWRVKRAYCWVNDVTRLLVELTLRITPIGDFLISRITMDNIIIDVKQVTSRAITFVIPPN